MNATTYAVDIAKNVFQVHWVEGETGEISRRNFSHAKFIEFFAQRQPARVVIEACGGAHHWARTFTAMGHQVELLPPHQVRPFVQGNKDDAADARGIWLAGQQSDIRRVPVKTAEQQAVLSLHRMRSHWVSVRTATINAMRGLLYEFGVRLPKGKEAGRKALTEQRPQIDEKLPTTMVRLINDQLAGLQDIERHVEAMDQEIALVQRNDVAAKRLRKAPGIGMLGATGLSAMLGDGSGWRNGREFACCLGLAPKHTGTGGKVKVSGMSKRGDPYLRSLLINGARAVVSCEHPAPWIMGLLTRRPFNVVVIAVAHKLARTAWAIVAHERDYDSGFKPSPPTCTMCSAT